ncbi:phage baseplate assembly protein [Shinella pollutisoli]|uniref:Phage baseplate assembly protein n=1 Tax=Shinella pollutisoli TaxID=2250594 RepID=A0ABV7DIC3_9HYPH|nr:phage baseplate assembly protein [Shinella pollutisoli]
MDKETADALRGIARRVTIKKINDDGEMQTASVEVADGIVREDVEVLQAFGQVSHAPEDGGLAIALSLGGDQGDMVILPIGNPSTRTGKTDPGTVGIANAKGDRVVVLPGGGIEVVAAGSITFKAGGCTLTMSGGGFAFSGGTITHDGVIIDKTHGHVSAPEGPPGPPVGG